MYREKAHTKEEQKMERNPRENFVSFFFYFPLLKRFTYGAEVSISMLCIVLYINFCTKRDENTRGEFSNNTRERESDKIRKSFPDTESMRGKDFVTRVGCFHSFPLNSSLAVIISLMFSEKYSLYKDMIGNKANETIVPKFMINTQHIHTLREKPEQEENSFFFLK